MKKKTSINYPSLVSHPKADRSSSDPIMQEFHPKEPTPSPIKKKSNHVPHAICVTMGNATESLVPASNVENCVIEFLIVLTK